MNGVRNTQRNNVIPKLTGPPFIIGAGNGFGARTPSCASVPDIANATNTDTIPFQNKLIANSPSDAPRDRWLAPITVSSGELWYQVPSGGR